MNNFVVADPNKCIGCRTCEIACVVAHADKDIFTAGSGEIDFNPKLTVVKTDKVSVPIQCRHCEDAPCANACPNGGIVKKDGALIVDANACIGCKTCLLACPIGAIDLVHEFIDGEKVVQGNLKDLDKGTFCFKERMIANKCDFCVGRENGPACVEVCPTQAFKIMQNEDLAKTVKNKRKQSASEIMFVCSKR